MAMREIRTIPDPVLRTPCDEITTIDDRVRSLVADLVETVDHEGRAGLAANQIGVDLQVFVFDCTDGANKRVVGVVCNPVLTLPDTGDRNLDDSEEGCLSLPGAYTYCARPDWSQVDGTDHTGAPVTYVGEGGTLARCLQHETDHLMGTVFGDRVPSRARKKLYKQAEAIAEDYPAEWPAVARVSSAHDL